MTILMIFGYGSRVSTSQENNILFGNNTSLEPLLVVCMVLLMSCWCKSCWGLCPCGSVLWYTCLNYLTHARTHPPTLCKSFSGPCFHQWWVDQKVNKMKRKSDSVVFKVNEIHWVLFYNHEFKKSLIFSFEKYILPQRQKCL